MNWLYYLAEANLYLGVFYLAYCLFLTKETYYQLTRAYLLFACVVSFILPVLQIGALKPVEAAVATTVAYALPEYTPQEFTPIATTPVVMEQHLTANDYLVYAYFIGAAIVFLMLMGKLFVLFRLMRNANRIEQDKHKLVYLPQTNVAFSFFNYLFIGTDAPGANTIIRHELVHIRQKHSVDIVFLELLKVVSWFNPFIYLMQNSLKTVHEYIADEQTAAYETDALTYSSFLVNNAYGAGASSITHSFFNYNLLKKRIVMLNQKRSGNLARLKYLVAVPVCAGLLCVSTLAFSKTYGWVDIDPAVPISLSPITTFASSTTNKSNKYLLAKPDKSPKKLVVVDGKIVDPKADETISADSMTDIPANTAWAIKKWGDKAKNGVRVFTGHATIIKKSESPLSHKDKFGGRVTGKLTNGAVPADPNIMFIVNGKRYNFTPDDVKNKTIIGISCDSMTLYQEGNSYAKATWGNNVGKVAVLHGSTAAVKIVSSSENKAEDPAGPVTPSGYKIGYESLTHYFTFTPAFLSGINYYQSSGFAKGPTIGDAVIVAGFNVGKDGHISNIKLVKPSNTVMDDATINSLNSYTGIVTDKPGFHTYLVHISTHGHTEDEDAIVCKKYGYDNHYTIAIAGTRSNSMAPDNAITTDGPHAVFEEFARYLAQNVHYPAVDRHDFIGGRVITVFAVTADGSLQYAKVVRSPSDLMSNEVMRVLKKWPLFSRFKPGIQYALPVGFQLGSEDPSTPVPEIKTRINVSSNIYNPNAVDIPDNPPGSLMLNEVILRGYIKKQ